MPKKEFHDHHSVPVTKPRARKMRRESTPSENILWQALRNRQVGGLKFLRQHALGPTIVDFYCHDKRLVLEIDGGIHRSEEVADYDKGREEYLKTYGVTIHRFTAEEVEGNLERVISTIRRITGS